MAYTELALLKKHVRADEFSSDDELLQNYLDAAEEWVISATNRTADELLELGGGSSLPLSLQQAVLLLAGHWYNQREAVGGTTMQEVPFGMDALIKPYRKLYDESSDSSSSSIDTSDS